MKHFPSIAAALCLASIAISVPTFVYLKNRNDSSIARDTRRIADALERAHPEPLELRDRSEPHYWPGHDRDRDNGR